jgi:hypothetical protein
MRFRGSLAAPANLEAFHQDLNDAFWSRTPKTSSFTGTKTGALVLDKALIGWHADMSQ